MIKLKEIEIQKKIQEPNNDYNGKVTETILIFIFLSHDPTWYQNFEIFKLTNCVYNCLIQIANVVLCRLIKF